MGNESPKSTLLSEGILLAFLTGAGYLLAYNYNVGYKDFYNIPSTFIEITILSIIKSFSVFISTVFSLITIINIVPIFIPKKESVLHSPVKKILITLSGLFVLAYLTNFALGISIAFGVIVLLFGFMEFILPLIRHRKVQGYKNKLSKSRGMSEVGDYKPDLYNLIANKIGRRNFLIIFAFFSILLMMPVTQLIGFKQASNAKEYLVVDGLKDSVVIIDTYKDYYLIKTIDLKNKTFDQDFTLMKQDDEKIKTAKLTWKKIGRLKPNK